MSTAPPESAAALQVDGPSRSRIVPVELPEPAADEVRVRTLYTGISRGTERLVYRGEVPASEHERMRAPFQRGDFPGPVIYGYSSVGRVEAGPAELLGRTVFCLYPHQSAYVVPASAVVPLPPGLPPARAVLAANMETAINALWDAAPLIGDRLSIVGGGTLGALVTALCARIPGADVELIDIEPARAEIAALFGARFRAPAEATAERDIVLHASASPAGLRTALELAATEALVVELSWFGSQEVGLPLGAAFHSRRLHLRSSQVGRIAPVRAGQRSHRERLELALALLTDARCDRLIDGEAEFAALPATLARMAAGGAGTFCQRVRYAAADVPMENKACTA